MGRESEIKRDFLVKLQALLFEFGEGAYLSAENSELYDPTLFLFAPTDSGQLYLDLGWRILAKPNLSEPNKMNAFDVLHDIYQVIAKAEAVGKDKHTARRYGLLLMSHLPKDSMVYQERHQHVDRAIANIYDPAD